MKNYSEKTQDKLYDLNTLLLGKNKNLSKSKFKIVEINEKRCYSDTEVDDLVGRTKSLNIATRTNSLNVSFDIQDDDEIDINDNDLCLFTNHFEELQLK